jgi:acyl carrier protein
VKPENHREERVLGDVARLVREVIAEEWAKDATIAMDTSFSRDLELESIEFVALAERIRAEYGKGIDLAGWLATMDLDQILALEVGQLVEFIVQCISQPKAE